MKKVIVAVFWISLAAFLLAGLGIVGGQLLGVVLGNGETVAGTSAVLNWPAFSLATVCSLAAFTLGYFPSEKKFQQEEE